jgi:TorA maturation chaperone TorD
VAVYRFLQAALARPTPEQHAWLAGAEFRRSLDFLCDQFAVAAPPDEPEPADPADHEARYLACFEVGLPEPPVVLLASHYNRREPVPQTIHEHVLFYQRFGARLAADNLEPADHLSNELAFLVHLDELLLTGALETESVLRARCDFLSRQPGRWVGRAAAAAADKGLPAVYPSHQALLAAAVEQDQARTQEALAGLPGEPSS